MFDGEGEGLLREAREIYPPYARNATEHYRKFYLRETREKLLTLYPTPEFVTECRNFTSAERGNINWDWYEVRELGKGTGLHSSCAVNL